MNEHRMAADFHLEMATRFRRSARLWFKWGLIGAGKDAMSQARRAWRNYRIHLGKIAP
jgi:hypothetical protein